MNTGMMFEFDYMDEYLQDMRGWDLTHNNKVVSFAMEKMFKTKDTTLCYMENILQRFEWNEKISTEKLKKVLEKNSFENLSGGRIIGEENQKHHFRKGVPGEWKKYFSYDNKKQFEKRYGDILRHYKYEDNDSWIERK